MRILGIDYGRARIGIALGDTDSRIANAWEVLQNEGMNSSVQKIQNIMKREMAEKLVVGMPRPLRDTSLENDQTREIRMFIEALVSAGMSVDVADEALTSKIADHQAHESGRKGSRDDLAAAAILQGWLERV